MRNRYFSDEELVAYLDGEIDFTPAAEIEKALRDDSALQVRLDGLRFDRPALIEAYHSLVPGTEIPPIQIPQQARRALPAKTAAGAIAAALVLGFALGDTMSSRPGRWTDYVAAYQALYSTSTLSHVSVSASRQQVELDRVSSSIGKKIAVNDLSLFSDITYTRAQVLSFKGRPLAQLAFLTGTGDPVALCIIRSLSSANEAPTLHILEGLSAALWSLNGYDYILIGGKNDELIARMASTFAGLRI